MPLFRELDPQARTEVSHELVRQENVVRSLYLDAVRKGVAFLLVVLLGGVALSVIEAPRLAPPGQVTSLACFLTGLTLVGAYYIVEHATLKRLVWNFSWFTHNVRTDQTDVTALFSPPQKMKAEWVQPTIAYAAFAAWVVGAALITGELRTSPAPATQTVTATVAREPRQASPDVSMPPVQPATAGGSAELSAKTDHFIGWSRADSIAMAAMIAAIVQAIALIVTFYIMWTSSRRQLRAFVGPDTFDLMEGNMLNPPQPAHANEPGAVVRIKNFGPTVAYKVRIGTRLAVIEPINEHTLVLAPLVDGFHSVLGPTVPSNSTAWLNRALTPGEIADIQAGVKAIYLYGRVEYVDIFKKRRFTAFRLRYAGQFPPPAPVMMSFAAQGNDAN
jgi:hypothetical protein